MDRTRVVTKAEFDKVCEAIWSELEYQNSAPIRQQDEADSVPAFLTLLRRYVRKVEDGWADNPAEQQNDGQIQVTEALHGLRKLAAIAARGMIYNGSPHRVVQIPP